MLRLVHFSSAALSGELSPGAFGTGCATRSDKRGLPKVFAFVEGSTLGGDARLLGWRKCYRAVVDEATLYDLREADPLGWRALGDREAADAKVLAEGYKGLRLLREDGAEIVCSFVSISLDKVAP